VIGVGITTMKLGSLEGLLMVVEDVKAVREELVKRGTDISEIDVQDWGILLTFVILMAIAGPCNNFQVAPSGLTTKFDKFKSQHSKPSC
jgi:hypothetical protein